MTSTSIITADKKKFPFSMLTNIWFYLLAILICGIIIQVNLLFCPDTCWLMHAGQKLLAGGNYYKDFFEVNPPMGIYIYLPPLLLAKITHLNILLSMQIYFFAIIIASLLLCCRLIDEITTSASPINNGLKLAVGFVFVILPAEAFSQREHLMLVLIMPYVLSINILSLNKNIARWQLIIISISAGIGFAIKPFFLLVYSFCEGYLIYKKKSVRSYFRLESYLILLTIITYIASIFIFTPAYITQVVPFIKPLYYLVNNFTWRELLFNLPLSYWLLTCALYFVLRKKCIHKELLDLFAIVAVGFVIIYLLQLTTWYYHILPFLTFSTLMAVLIFTELYSTNFIIIQKLTSKNNLIFSLLFLTLLFPISYAITKTEISIASRYYSQTVQLINLFKIQANNANVYYLNTFVEYPLALEFYSNAHITSRFPSLWILLGVKILKSLPPSPARVALIEKTQSFMINTIIDELVQANPKFILSQNIPVDAVNNFRNMHYLPILLQYPRFKTFFKNYVYIGTLTEEDIYERKNYLLK